MAVLLS